HARHDDRGARAEARSGAVPSHPSRDARERGLGVRARRRPGRPAGRPAARRPANGAFRVARSGPRAEGQARARVTRAQRFVGYTTMKLSRFGILTFGSVRASITSFSPMIPFSCNRYAVTA